MITTLYAQGSGAGTGWSGGGAALVGEPDGASTSLANNGVATPAPLFTDHNIEEQQTIDGDISRIDLVIVASCTGSQGGSISVNDWELGGVSFPGSIDVDAGAALNTYTTMLEITDAAAAKAALNLGIASEFQPAAIQGTGTWAVDAIYFLVYHSLDVDASASSEDDDAAALGDCFEELTQ